MSPYKKLGRRIEKEVVYNKEYGEKQLGHDYDLVTAAGFKDAEFDQQMGFAEHPRYDAEGNLLKFSHLESPEKIMEVSRNLPGHDYFLWLE